MNIIEVGEKLPKFTGSMVKACGDDYWFVTGNGIFNQDDKEISPCRAALLATDYELYEEGIRPKEAGELWKYGKHLYAIGSDSKGLYVVSLTVFCPGEDRATENMIHGVNGWTREKPPIEDERVEIVGITVTKEEDFLLRTSDHKTINFCEDKGKLIFLTNKGEG